jgi:hypothetical protein
VLKKTICLKISRTEIASRFQLLMYNAAHANSFFFIQWFLIVAMVSFFTSTLDGLLIVGYTIAYPPGTFFHD